MIEQIDSAESADLALTVSGPQFVTAFRRVQFAADRKWVMCLSLPDDYRVMDELTASMLLLDLMTAAQRNGWDIAQKAVDLLPGPRRSAPEV
jgi:predicted protein tyrosine phosphatase